MASNMVCGCNAAADTTSQNQNFSPLQAAAIYRPDIDIRESVEEFVVVADVPGATPEAIDLTVDQGVLTLRASVQPRDPTGSRRIVREYGVGTYERSFRIGESVDADKIAADLKEGVLTLRLPKSEVTRARKIKVAG